MRRHLLNQEFALAFCLVGRAFDVATTWTALSQGRAAEAKTGAAQIFYSLGPTLGVAFCELVITTPVIFIGYALAKRLVFARRTGQPAPRLVMPAEIALLYFVGALSFAITLYNYRFLM